MPIPSPEERSDLYDDMDCRPGCSYPAAGLEKLRAYVKRDPVDPALAKTGPIDAPADRDLDGDKE